MQYVNTMYQGAKDYYEEIPTNTPIAMAYAFGAAFVLETIFEGDPVKGIAAGAISAIASAIHGLVTPLFKLLTGGRTQLTHGEEMCRTFVGIIGAACMETAATGRKSIFNKLIFLSILHSIF